MRVRRGWGMIEQAPLQQMLERVVIRVLEHAGQRLVERIRVGGVQEAPRNGFVGQGAAPVQAQGATCTQAQGTGTACAQAAAGVIVEVQRRLHRVDQHRRVLAVHHAPGHAAHLAVAAEGVGREGPATRDRLEGGQALRKEVVDVGVERCLEVL